MPSFDVSSDVNWQELDNAINQTLKEVGARFDFKGMVCTISADVKAKTLSLTCSEESKMDSLVDTFQTKLVKRGVSLLCFEFKETEKSGGRSGKKTAVVKAGISKEDGKKIIKLIKEQKFTAQGQIQDEQVRVSAKKRDELQEVIAFLKLKQDELKIPMQFGNYRD